MSGYIAFACFHAHSRETCSVSAWPKKPRTSLSRWK